MIRDTIVFTVHMRPWYLREVLASWGEVRGIQDWRIIFKVEPSPLITEVTKVIDHFRHPDKQVVFNPEKLGVLVNPWDGLDTSFRTGAQFSVVAEEDLIVSDDVLEYLTWARDEFLDQPRVLGAMCQMQGMFESDDPSEVALVQDFNPWIWGTWTSRWKSVLRDTWDKDYSSGGATDGGWDWNIAKRLLPRFDMVMAVTGAARSQNIGKFLGTHASPDDFEGTQAKTFSNHRDPVQYRVVGDLSDSGEVVTDIT